MQLRRCWFKGEWFGLKATSRPYAHFSVLGIDTMVNTHGQNQYGGKLGECSSPDDCLEKYRLTVSREVLALDDVALTKLFQQFNREKDGAGLSVDEQLARLRSLHCSMRSVFVQPPCVYDDVLMRGRVQQEVYVQVAGATQCATRTKQDQAGQGVRTSTSCSGSQAERRSRPLGRCASATTFGEQGGFDI